MILLKKAFFPRFYNKTPNGSENFVDFQMCDRIYLIYQKICRANFCDKHGCGLGNQKIYNQYLLLYVV